MLRVLRAEIQDLRDIFADIQSGATSIELQRTYLTNACATVDAAMKALDTTFLVQDDVFRHISNAWKRIRGYPLWQQPGTSAAAGDQVQKQIQTVEILDQQLRKMIMWIGYLTIPSRLETWLESTSPGYAIPFHAVFADEVPDADDRQKILSMLAMNACHMASVEVAYQVSATTHTEQDNLHRTIYVATEDYMPAYSLPYHDILTRLGAQPDMEAADLSRLIVERYCAFFRDAALGIPWGQDGWPVGVTLTAVDLAAVQRLALTVRSLSDALRADLDGQFNALSEAHIAAKTFDEDLHLYDLKSFCDALIEQQGAPATTLKAAKALSAALADASLCLARDYTSPAYAQLGGLTTYLMQPDAERRYELSRTTPRPPVQPQLAGANSSQPTMRWHEFRSTGSDSMSSYTEIVIEAYDVPATEDAKPEADYFKVRVLASPAGGEPGVTPRLWATRNRNGR